MLSNTFLQDFKIDNDQNRKNAIMDFCHFNKNNSSNKSLLGVDNSSNKTFFNYKNEEKFIHISKKAK